MGTHPGMSCRRGSYILIDRNNPRRLLNSPLLRSSYMKTSLFRPRDVAATTPCVLSRAAKIAQTHLHHDPDSCTVFKSVGAISPLSYLCCTLHNQMFSCLPLRCQDPSRQMLSARTREMCPQRYHDPLRRHNPYVYWQRLRCLRRSHALRACRCTLWV